MRLLRHKTLSLAAADPRQQLQAAEPLASARPWHELQVADNQRDDTDTGFRGASVADFSGKWRMDLSASDSLTPVLKELGSRERERGWRGKRQKVGGRRGGDRTSGERAQLCFVHESVSA